MGFNQDARRAAAAADRSRLRSEAAKLDQQWREIQEAVAELQAQMQNVIERLDRLDKPSKAATRRPRSGSGE
jgi:uncharacterized protein YlxW (UPF0749 family)